MNTIQAIVNQANTDAQKQRSTEQMTLGTLIQRLEQFDPGKLVSGVRRAISYRGYYCGLAIEPQGESVTAGRLLEICRGAMDNVLEGYKGGEYIMGRNTPVWVASYSELGPRLISIDDDGSFELAEDTD